MPSSSSSDAPEVLDSATWEHVLAQSHPATRATPRTTLWFRLLVAEQAAVAEQLVRAVFLGAPDTQQLMLAVPHSAVPTLASSIFAHVLIEVPPVDDSQVRAVQAHLKGRLMA